MKCLVKEKGKSCSRVAGIRGQCDLHYNYFKNEIKAGRMTWNFLELSGEANPPKKKFKRGKI